jgi:hypothetical protein
MIGLANKSNGHDRSSYFFSFFLLGLLTSSFPVFRLPYNQLRAWCSNRLASTALLQSFYTYIYNSEPLFARRKSKRPDLDLNQLDSRI